VPKSRAPLAQPRPGRKSRQRGNRLKALQKNLQLNKRFMLSAFLRNGSAKLPGLFYDG
jgi:hypothetical protein